MDMKNVIEILAENKGMTKRQLLEDIADAACTRVFCNGVSCSDCPFDKSQVDLEARMGAMIEELY